MTMECTTTATTTTTTTTANELSLGGSSPYTSTDKTNENKCTQMKQYEKHGTNNTKHRKYKYTLV